LEGKGTYCADGGGEKYGRSEWGWTREKKNAGDACEGISGNKSLTGSEKL